MPEVSCGNCGRVIDEPSDLPAGERRPCPSCGATHRTARGAAALVLGTRLSARGELWRTSTVSRQATGTLAQATPKVMKLT